MSNTPPIPQAPRPPELGPKPTDPKEGTYKARAVAPDTNGLPHEFGTSKNGLPELLVHLFVPALNRTYVSALYFSRDAAQYSKDRLRALGCRDLATLAGIDQNEVDVSLVYEVYDNKWRMRVQVLSGGGIFKSSNPMAGGGKEFEAVVRATLGHSLDLTGATPSENGKPKPPF